ncbi:D-serine deaminase-like pyridoxal phosphate-dependent protein [Nonomuraea polychroma]|uniref:D-serine deaminase-like pyridoxal phosphate-dependent protein n=1 Tax=Nonomuraea polychroma TaxID=46176 RepID=A0A438MDZ8_9ACTN|nr:alanine racemase [Nonomuraea polychroma]RVX44029.1 D-serine deaminase-like pyridoxal phosphate-dependent protein [Nonomuraea polychroma]
MTIKLSIPAERIDWRTKGLWWPGPAVSLDEFAAQRHHLFGGAFTWPVMVAGRAALLHNIDTLARFCARHGLEFAPHGKTTMAPSLFAAQLAAGATAITVATAGQALACRAFGVPSVLLANELLDPGPLRWAAEQVQQGFDFLCCADSVSGVRTMAAAVASVPGRRPLRVLAELGHPGGRTGCRTVAELCDVARAVAEAPGLELAGVAAYEGGLPDAEAAGRYLAGVRAAVHRLSVERLLGDEVVVTAGGSKYFDVVADRLAGTWLPGHRLRVVLRSGAYISHDDGIYQDWTPFRRIPEEGSLEPALHVWAQVLSTPEDGLAIVGMGKREVAYDEGLPMPQQVRALDGTLRPAGGLRVRAVNDHHAYVEVTAPAAVAPGELIRFGVSHPCTAFDKWQVIPVIDEAHTVVDLIRTYF